MIKLRCFDYFASEDLEIILLKARLEQTEKAMEKLIAQMSALANNNPQTIVNSEKKNDQVKHIENIS